MYLFEMDDSKDPDEDLFGSRQLKVIYEGHKVSEGAYQVMRSSIYDKSQWAYDGHINRNLRACMALIDMAKPYITVLIYSETELAI